MKDTLAVGYTTLISRLALVVLIFVSGLIGERAQAGEAHVRMGLVGIPRYYRATEAEWSKLLRASRGAGIDLMSVGYQHWKDTELRPGVFVWNDFAALLRIIPRTGVRLALDLPIPISLSGEADDLPPGLHFSSFDDPALNRRYRSFIRSAIATFGSHLDYVTFHTENSELFVANHPKQRESLCQFLSRSAAFGRKLAPSVKFATYNTPRHPDGLVECMARGMDVLGIAAIAEFPGDTPGDFARRLAHMAGLSGRKPIAIVEMGWPSSFALGSSEAIQEKVVKNMLAALDKRVGQIAFASYYTVFDEDRALARKWIAVAFPPPIWSDAQRSQLAAWFTSLGLKTIDGRPKPAWWTLVNRPR